MSDKTSIGWTNSTWNPTTGCDVVSPGCDHCYALTFAERWRGTPGHYFEHGFDVQLRPDKLDLPLRWKKPRMIFVNSMSDLFHKDIPDEYVAEVFKIMAATPQHTYQVLTKRPGRMRSLLRRPAFWADVLGQQAGTACLPNVWLGVSAEDQKWADIRIPVLVETPAAIRFVSAEPLLGPINLRGPNFPLLDWVIVGGESGRGARPMEWRWAYDLRDQCSKAGVALFVKQAGSFLAKELGLSGKGEDFAQACGLPQEFPAVVA